MNGQTIDLYDMVPLDTRVVLYRQRTLCQSRAGASRNKCANSPLRRKSPRKGFDMVTDDTVDRVADARNQEDVSLTGPAAISNDDAKVDL